MKQHLVSKTRIYWCSGCSDLPCGAIAACGPKAEQVFPPTVSGQNVQVKCWLVSQGAFIEALARLFEKPPFTERRLKEPPLAP